MNKRQGKKQLLKWNKRMRYARKNGESLSITHQSLILKDKEKKETVNNIDKMQTHKPRLKISRSGGEKPISSRKWLS